MGAVEEFSPIVDNLLKPAIIPNMPPLTERDAAERGVLVRFELSGAKAQEICATAAGIAGEMNATGCIIVCGLTRKRKLAFQAIGEPNLDISFFRKVASSKLKTVYAFHQSTSITQANMQRDHESPADYGNAVGSTFAGGVAIFADEEHTQFIGAIAFSGGPQKQDEEICRQAIKQVGFYTDLPEETTSHAADDASRSLWGNEPDPELIENSPRYLGQD